MKNIAKINKNVAVWYKKGPIGNSRFKEIFHFITYSELEQARLPYL
jgi:hypothetical protein